MRIMAHACVCVRPRIGETGNLQGNRAYFIVATRPLPITEMHYNKFSPTSQYAGRIESAEWADSHLAVSRLGNSANANICYLILRRIVREKLLPRWQRCALCTCTSIAGLQDPVFGSQFRWNSQVLLSRFVGRTCLRMEKMSTFGINKFIMKQRNR